MVKAETKEITAAPGAELSPREDEILRAVVEQNILTGAPVGSKSLSRSHALGVSPSTVRSVMQRLTRKGYLVQPHPSAGRAPTDKAFCRYAERLLEIRSSNAENGQEIEEFVDSQEIGVPEIMKLTSRRLSVDSSFTGLATSPDLRCVALSRIEFVRLGTGLVLSLFVTGRGVIENRVVITPEDARQEDLDKYSRYLNDILDGLTLQELKARIRKEMEDERILRDILMGPALALVLKALDFKDTSELFVEGKENLLDLVSTHGMELIKNVIRDLEDKTRILSLLEKAIEAQGVEVFVGSEGPLDMPGGLSVVASPYRQGELAMGVVGVLGPSRMNYGDVIALVDRAGRLVSRFLTVLR